ncbi:MAG: right-handed parallel beta-helix repeat-containing protein [Candidatus Heimdallarchaeaceae archaeon]
MLRRNIAEKIFPIIIVFLLFVFLKPTHSSPLNEMDEISQQDYTSHAPILIETDSDFIIGGFPGSGSRADPYRIENYNITSISESYGINISATSQFFVIKNCYIDCVDYGIWISWVGHSTANILNNTIVNHNLFALKLRDASGAHILNNLIDNSGDGLSLDNSDDIIINNNTCTHNINKAMTIKFGENITLENNYFARNEIGLDIRFFRDVWVSNNTFFKNREYGIKVFNIIDSIFQLNTIKKNKDQGLLITYTSNAEIKSNHITNNKNGIFAEGLSSTKIFNNTLNSNLNRGIRFQLSDNNLITYNRFRNNTVYGIYLNFSNNNIIHHNNFIDNNLGGLSQAYSSGDRNNTWFDTTRLEGNFWSNLFGGGYYQIEGSISLHDFYPLDEPILIPRPFEPLEQNPYLIFWVIIPPILFMLVVSLISFVLNVDVGKRVKRRSVRETLTYVERKRKIAFSDNIGTALFRFGKDGGNIVIEDLRSLELNLELFIGYCYATIGLGQRYETGVFGPLPTPSLQKYNVIIFAFWGLDDEPSDPRLEGKQYYLVSVIYPESQNKNIIRINTMNDKFKNYVKKFKYPNRMTIEDLNHFREIVFV